MKQRLAKFISQNGICSRRDAERLILEGKVKVNNIIINNVVTFINPGDLINVNNVNLYYNNKDNRDNNSDNINNNNNNNKSNIENIGGNQIRLWLFYKPKGTITTHKDPERRKTVFDLLPNTMPYVVSIGRLDVNSEGLLLLTNSGALARYFELPINQIKRVYKCRMYGYVPDDLEDRLRRGVIVNGIKYKSIDIKIDSQSGGNTWATMYLTEGKNREIRKILENFNLKVNRLIRISYGEFNLGDLAVGNIKEVEYSVIPKFEKN